MIPFPDATAPLVGQTRLIERPWRNLLAFLYGLFKGDPAGRAIHYCTGTPEAQVTASIGSLALRTDGGAGTTLYVKESGTGNTGWAAK